MKGIGSYIKIFIIIAFFLTIIIGKKVIDSKTYDFTEDVRTSLNRYYVTGDKRDLDKIVDIMDKYENDRDYIGRLEDYASKEVEKMYNYISGKYLCDKKNKNACPQALDELNKLNDKIDVLYNYKSKGGSDIINPSTYNSLNRLGEQKTQQMESIIKSFATTNAPSSEDVRLVRCEKAVECNCNNNSPTCSCKFNTDKVSITLTCKNKDYVPKEE